MRPRRRWSSPDVLLAALVVAYVGLSLAPGEWDPPRHPRNGAERVGAALVLDAPGIATVPPGTVPVPRRAVSSPLTVDLVVRASGDQSGPARILSWSAGIHDQSLMVGQEGGALVVRVRRPGGATVVEPGVFTGRGPRHVVVRVAADETSTVVDGHLVDRQRATTDPVASWHPDHQLVLGNEHGGTRPWMGRVDRAVVTTGGAATDLLGVLEVPERFWQVPDRWSATPAWDDPWDPRPTQAVHATALLVVGGLAAAGRRRPGRALATCWLLSTVVFAAKFLAGGRHPSLADLLVEATAAAVGVGAVTVASWAGARRARRAAPGPVGVVSRRAGG